MTESETYGKKDEDDGTHSQLSTERLQMSMDRPQGSPVDCFDERASLLEKTTPTLANTVSHAVRALHRSSYTDGTTVVELVFGRAVYSRVAI